MAWPGRRTVRPSGKVTSEDFAASCRDLTHPRANSSVSAKAPIASPPMEPSKTSVVSVLHDLLSTKVSLCHGNCRRRRRDRLQRTKPQFAKPCRRRRNTLQLGFAWPALTKIERPETGSVAAYTHDTSRELDPQLHTHAVAANLTYDGTEARWKALLGVWFV